MKIITLLTDFGSFYPAQMKGVILSRLADKAQDITFVDIAHFPQSLRLNIKTCRARTISVAG